MGSIKEKREVTKELEVTVAIKCDFCENQESYDGFDMLDGWYSFSSSHHGWGNDSVDSHEYHSVCSPKCLANIILKTIREDGDEDGFEVANMNATFANRLANGILNIQI